MSKTACIVNPGRAVRHEGKRHVEGAVLHLDQADVKQLTENGFVSIWTPPAAPAGTETAETGRLAIDNFVQALADGQLAQGQADASTGAEGDVSNKADTSVSGEESGQPAAGAQPHEQPSPPQTATAKTVAAKTPSRRR